MHLNSQGAPRATPARAVDRLSLDSATTADTGPPVAHAGLATGPAFTVRLSDVATGHSSVLSLLHALHSSASASALRLPAAPSLVRARRVQNAYGGSAPPGNAIASLVARQVREIAATGVATPVGDGAADVTAAPTDERSATDTWSAVATGQSVVDGSGTLMPGPQMSSA